MDDQTLHEIIQEGLKDLPEESLVQVAEFVLFLRKRTLDPQAFQDDLEAICLEAELGRMARAEGKHLEEEFADYERKFPRQ